MKKAARKKATAKAAGEEGCAARRQRQRRRQPLTQAARDEEGRAREEGSATEEGAAREESGAGQASPSRGWRPGDRVSVPAGSDWTRAELTAIRAQLVDELAEMRTAYDRSLPDLTELQLSSADGAGDDQADAGSKTFEREQEQSIAANRLDLMTQIAARGGAHRRRHLRLLRELRQADPEGPAQGVPGRHAGRRVQGARGTALTAWPSRRGQWGRELRRRRGRQPIRADPPHPGRRRRIRLLGAVAAAVVALDVVSKLLVVANLGAGHAPVRVLFGALYLVQTRNSGAAFSLGTGATVILTLIALVVVAVIVRTARRLRSTGWAVALGLILGGALGNLADRIFRAPGVGRGHVVDWISLFGADGRVLADLQPRRLRRSSAARSSARSWRCAASTSTAVRPRRRR